MPARLRPTAPIAADAILVGDPGRALLLAQMLLEQPKMSNHARGLWGYSGQTPGGHELTIQSTGMGGPSAAIVLADLAELGVRRAIRVGTCVAMSDDPGLGQLVVVNEAAAPGGDTTRPDAALAAALTKWLGRRARGAEVLSLDTLHRPAGGQLGTTADVADMQTAALFSRGAELGVAVAAVLIVAETGEGHLADEELEEAAKLAGEASSAVLSA